MNSFNSYRLYFTPLAPLHIGTGESYEPTHYVIDDDVLYEFDSEAVLTALSGKERDELLKIANGIPGTEMLKKLQSFFFSRREWLKAYAVNQIPVSFGVAKFYVTRVGKTVNQEFDGAQVLNKLGIDRTAFNPISRKPVLFGSSMKGAIRTALLNQLNEGKSLQNNEESQQLQQRLFGGKFASDPLRLLHISDAMSHGDAGLPATQIYFAVNRKKHPVIDDDGALRKAMGENLYQLLECVPAWRYRAFAGSMNLQQLGALAKHPDTPKEDKYFNIEQIAKACNEFYLPILRNEQEILKNRGYLHNSWDEALEKVLACSESQRKQGAVFLLRVGRHSGAESVTLEGVRKIKILKGNPEFQAKALTLWLAAEQEKQRNNLLPFGWLLVEVQPLQQPEQQWQELQALCDPHLESARAFAVKRDSQQGAMARIRSQCEAARQQEADALRLKTEETARQLREEAERLARFQTLSEQSKQVEQFRQRMLQEKSQCLELRINGQWFQDLRKLAESAAAWQASDKAALLALVRDISQLDSRLKKNKHIKELIRRLE